MLCKDGLPPQLFKPEVNWSALVGASGVNVQKIFSQVTSILTLACGDGLQDSRGLILRSEQSKIEEKERHERVMALSHKLISESSSGAIDPHQYSNFFAQTDSTLRGTENYEPDLTFQDWAFQRQMKLELESRASWDAQLEFVRMDQAGMIKYGKFVDTKLSMVNHEYGAGIPIKTTWFETNMFGIEMENLAPKFRFAYFDELMSTSIYTTFQAAISTTVSLTHNVIRDLNTGMLELMRKSNSFGKFPWGKAKFRIVAPPEAQWILDAAYAMTYANLSRETLLTKPAITYTTKLPAGTTIYLIVDKWEQNELGIRVPFGVYGQAKDIDTFAEKIAYRGAWGFQMDVNSGRKLVLDPSQATFIIGGPVGVKDFGIT